MKKNAQILMFLILTICVLPSFGLAQEVLKAPETLEEAQEFGEEVLGKTKEQLPGILEKTWKEDILPIWRKMLQMWSSFWDNTVQPWLVSIADRIKVLLGQEIEKRKPYIEQELEKETEELIEDIEEEIPKAKSLWERLKELFQ